MRCNVCDIGEASVPILQFLFDRPSPGPVCSVFFVLFAIGVIDLCFQFTRCLLLCVSSFSLSSSDLSSILQQLLTSSVYAHHLILDSFHILNKDYCIRFLVPFSPLFHSQIREGQLQTEVVQFAKHSKNAPEITIDGKLYSVVQRVKVWMSHSNHG